jgi:hypothetical protein
VAIALFVGLGLVVGLLIRRWWALVVVPPAVVVLIGLLDSPLPSSIHWWIAFVAGASTAGGLGLALLLRYLAGRPHGV